MEQDLIKFRGQNSGFWKSAEKHQVEGRSPSQVGGLQRVAGIWVQAICGIRKLREKSSPVAW